MEVLPNNISLSQIFIIFILLLLLLQLRQRKFHFWRSLILPGLMLLVTVDLIYMEMMGALFNLLVLVGGGILGVLLGMAVASQMKIKIAEDGSLLLRGSFLAVTLWALIILAKFYGQDTLNQWGLDSYLLLSLFLMITVTSMISQRVYIYYRYLQKKRHMKERGIEFR